VLLQETDVVQQQGLCDILDQVQDVVHAGDQLVDLVAVDRVMNVRCSIAIVSCVILSALRSTASIRRAYASI
jgi:hypothetical protein